MTVQHSIREWQHLHGLTSLWRWQSSLRAKIDNAKNRVNDSVKVTPPLETHLNGERAWGLVADAFRNKFPAHKGEINAVERTCKRDFSPATTSHEIPYVIPKTGKQPPFVRIPFEGSVADLISVAHEFGHALQYSLSRHSFLPPIVREIAAFVSARLFVEYLKTNDPKFANSLSFYMSADEKMYLINDGEKLLKDAEKPNATYHYQHNYPLAWIGAEEIVKWNNDVIIWEVFRGHIPANAVCAELSANTESADNFPQSHYAKSGTHLYAAMASLDPICNCSIYDAHAQIYNSLSLDCAPSSQGITYPSAFGMALELLAKSPYHRNIQIGDYFRSAILPPLYLGQLRFSLNKNGQALGLISWAELPETILSIILKNGRAIARNEWGGGSEIFINDIVGGPRQMRMLIEDFQKAIHPNRVLHGIVRNSDQSIRRVLNWGEASSSDQHEVCFETVST